MFWVGQSRCLGCENRGVWGVRIKMFWDNQGVWDWTIKVFGIGQSRCLVVEQ